MLYKFLYNPAMPIKKLLLLFLVLLVSSCATTTAPSISNDALKNEILIQEQNQLLKQIAYQKKLDVLAYPLNKAALPFCQNNKTYRIGLYVLNQYSYADEFKKIAKNKLKLSEDLTVQWAIKGSPTAHLNIQKGDTIVSVNEQKITKGEDAFKQYLQLLKTAYIKKQTPIKLTLKRNNKTLNYKIKPDTSCDYLINAKLSPSVNAIATGQQVVIYSNLMDTLSDDSVSFVIAHEIAHNTQNHIPKSYLRIAIGSLAGIALSPSIGINAFGGLLDGGLIAYYFGSKDLEQEADYVGMYIIANSGIALQRVDKVWRNYSLAVGDFTRSQFIETHPTFPNRHLTMLQTIKEIKAKKQKGLPLLPN